MPVLAPEQVYALALGAGLDPAAAVIATAVAGPGSESGWDTEAFNPADPNGGSIGLWQINGVHWPRYGGRDALRDPATNARAMADISARGADWSPWGGYTSGRYRANLPAAQAAAKTVDEETRQGGKSFLEGLADSVSGKNLPFVGGLIGKAGDAAGGFVTDKMGDALVWAIRELVPWSLVRRILLVLGGMLLAAAGLVFLGKDALVPAGAVTAVKRLVPRG